MQNRCEKNLSLCPKAGPCTEVGPDPNFRKFGWKFASPSQCKIPEISSEICDRWWPRRAPLGKFPNYYARRASRPIDEAPEFSDHCRSFVSLLRSSRPCRTCARPFLRHAMRAISLSWSTWPSCASKLREEGAASSAQAAGSSAAPTAGDTAPPNSAARAASDSGSVSDSELVGEDGAPYKRARVALTRARVFSYEADVRRPADQHTR